MFYEYWGFDEWCTITTIFLSVVAIVIAIWSSRSTSKAAEKQIREIKQLSALQIETSIKQLEAEIQKMMAKVDKASIESTEIAEFNRGAEHLGAEYRNRMAQIYQVNEALRDVQVYNQCLLSLRLILKELRSLKQKMG